jgi:ribose/xylose/arabinose/galactoside ABC-type transport system permease subunit
MTARLRRRSEGQAVVLFTVLVVALLLKEPQVFNSLDVVLKTVALTGLVAGGLTLVIVQGELDLSVGSMVALSGGLVATTSDSLLVGTLIALAAGVGVGVINGLLVTRVGVNSFIATLSTMITFGGLAFVVTGGVPVPIHDLEGGIAFGNSVIGTLTPKILIFAGVMVLLHLFLSRARIGREFYAVGGNREAAAEAGMRVRRRMMLAFIMCSVIAALAGAVQTIELTSADPNLGNRVLLNAIAAAVIGGAHLQGGRGTIIGTTIGAISLAGLTVGLQFEGISPNTQDIIVGCVLVLAVTADRQELRRLRVAAAWRRLRARSAEDHLTKGTPA